MSGSVASFCLNYVGFYLFDWDVHEGGEVEDGNGLVFFFFVEDFDIVEQISGMTL